MGKKIKIPRLAHAFFKWYCKPEKYEELHGDLEEFFYESVEEKGQLRARLYYVWNVIRCFQPYAWKLFQSQNSNSAMLKNFYFTTIRNLAKNKSYFLINVSGLAIGLASFAFISLYVINELSYDRFHSKYDRIYRVSNKAAMNDEVNEQATTASPMARAMVDNYPEVVSATRILKASQLLIGRGTNKFNEDEVLYADSALFSVFDFKMLKGNPGTALANPQSLVLTQSSAKKYFGNEDPVGQNLTVEEDTILYQVTGVVEDVPPNSHIQFDMLASLNSTDYGNTPRWIGRSLHVYALLRDGAQPVPLQKKMKELFYLHMAPEIEYYTGLSIQEWEAAGSSVNFVLTPIQDIHLYSGASLEELQPTGNIAYIYIYSLIGVIILFIAIFNFVNLATAHSATRAKEVGVRKVIGSTKRALVYQFLLESILISLVSSMLSIMLIFFLTPSFVELVGKGLAFDLTTSFVGVGGMLGLGILVGILAGFYPSFVLSAFKPVDVIKGTLTPKGKAGWLRNVLVTVQFAASIVIIIGTLAVYHQIEFMLTKSLGFDKDQVLVLKRPDWLQKNLEVFKRELLKNPNIKVVANSETIPGKTYDIRSYRKIGQNQVYLFQNNQVTYEHQELMGLELVAGRFFSKDHRSDSNAVILNESAAKAFGFDDPIGKPLISAFKDGQITIIGVIKDYNVESLHKNVAPVSLELLPDANGYLSVKMSTSQNVLQTVGYIEDTWGEHSNGKPFQYFFLDEEYQNLYKSEASTGKILLVFSTLSIFIACMGLIGLITYTASIRRKEIGIRKVLGASASALVRLLSSEVARLVIIATLIAWPLAYLATDYWLQSFADRATISPLIYLGASLAVMFVVGIAISFQTIKALTDDPVDSLRQE